MITKLTLTVEEDVLNFAKKYATLNGSTLSGIVEEFLKKLPEKKPIKQKKFSPVIEELLGSVKLPDDFNYKETLGGEIMKKHYHK